MIHGIVYDWMKQDSEDHNSEQLPFTKLGFFKQNKLYFRNDLEISRVQKKFQPMVAEKHRASTTASQLNQLAVSQSVSNFRNASPSTSHNLTDS